MMIGMTIDVVENSAWALRTAALGALVFDVFYVVHRLLQGFGPDDATPAGISAFSLAHRSALLASEVAVGLALLAIIVFIAAFTSLIRQAGREGYVRMIGDDCRLAAALHAHVSRHPELEAATLSLSIATFRYVPRDLRAAGAKAEDYLNTLNETLLDRLKLGGEAFDRRGDHAEGGKVHRVTVAWDYLRRDRLRQRAGQTQGKTHDAR